MAVNTENDKYWVRHITDDGNYQYYNIDSNQISDFIKEHPNAQGLMRDGDNNILPYNLTKINDVQTMDNYSLYGLSNDNILEYDRIERDSVRPYRKSFEAFDKVMSDEGVAPGTPLHTLMLNTIAYESVGFSDRDGVGGKDRAKGLSQIIGGTFRDMINRGPNTPITQGYWRVCEKYNNGKPITHDDLLKPEFDEAAIALGLNVMMDKLATAKRLENIDLFAENFDTNLIPYLYAKFYNSGDANGDIEEHTKQIRDKQKSVQVLYDRGRRYYKNYNTLNAGQKPIDKIQEEPKIESEKVEIEVEKTPEERDAELRLRMKNLVDESDLEVNSADNTTGGKVPTFLEMFANRGVAPRSMTQFTDTQDALKTSLENRLKVNDVATAKLYQQVHEEITPLVKEKVSTLLDNNKEYFELKTYIDGFAPKEEREKTLSDIVSGISASASPEEAMKYLQEQAKLYSNDIDSILATLTPEERETYFDVVDSIDSFEQQEYNLAYDELMDERMNEYQTYLYDAIVEKYKPKSELEYFMCQTLSQSIIGKVLLASTSEEAKNLFNEGLMSYDANGWTDFGAGLSAMLLDMPVFNIGGAIGSAAFKGLSAVSKLVTQKAILTGITKGKNVARAIGLGSKSAEATVHAGNRLAKMQLQQLRTNKLMRIGVNLTQGAIGGASSFGFHSTVSQFANNFDIDDINWNEVGNSAILGASMSFLHPFKEMLPSAIQKRVGMPILDKMNKAGANNISRNLKLKDIGNRTLQGTARVAFVGTIEAPLFDYQSRLINGDTSDFNYFNAIKEHAPMFIALGVRHMGKHASLTSKGNARTFNGEDYYGISSPFKSMARNPYARMEKSDYDNITEATGFQISKVSDIYKLNKEQRIELDKALMSKDMPIVTRNRYLMMVGDANTTVPFTLIEGDYVDHIELKQNKNGVYEYSSYDANHNMIDKRVLHGYSEAEAIAFNEMSKHNIEMQHVQRWSNAVSDSYIEGAKIQQNIEVQNKQSELLNSITDKNGKVFSSIEELESRALQIIEKQPSMRTDRETSIVDAYTTYLYEASNILLRVGNAANATSASLNMPRAEINRVLKLEPEQRTGADADIYEIFDAYLNGRDIPENATYKDAVAKAEAVVRQIEENKQPASTEDITPQVEMLLMSRMNSSQRLNYINRRFISADGNIEYVAFSDGTDAIRITEQTGNVVYRDAFGRDFTPTESQLQEYNSKMADNTLSDISYKISAQDASNQILEIQARQAGLLKNSASKTIADAEGTIEYVKPDGSISFGKVKSVDGNGDYTLLDGTVVKASDIRTDNTKFISERVDAIMKDDYVPAGYNASERPKESTMKTMASQDFPRFISISKLWNPDVNMMAIIESRIAKTQADIEKLQNKLTEISELEATSNEKFQHLRSKTEADLNRKIADLAKVEKAREDYISNYPIDKANYDAMQYEMRIEAEKKADAEKQAKKQAELEAEEKAKLARQKENRANAGKNYNQREQERLEQEKAQQQEKERLEKEERKRRDKHNEREVELNRIWREADEQKAKAEEAEAERIASLTTDQKFADLHRRLNIFDGKKGINKDFSPEQHYSLMEVYFPELGKIDIDVESFKMNLDAVVATSNELAKRKKQLDSDLKSLSPKISLRAKADKSSTEKMFKTAEDHLQSLLSSMESIALRMREQGDSSYMDAVRAVKDQLAKGRTVADKVWELLEPKKEGKPIETIKEKSKEQSLTKDNGKKNNKKNNKEKSKEQEIESDSNESIGEESIDITINTSELDIASALKGNVEPETLVSDSKVENVSTTEQLSTPIADNPTPKAQEKQETKAKPKAPSKPKKDSGLKMTIKKTEKPKVEQPKPTQASIDSAKPEAPVQPEKTTPVNNDVELKVADLSKTRFISGVKGDGINISISRAKSKNGKLIKSEVIEGTKDSQDGWSEEFDMEINIDGIADNNNLGDNWDALNKAYNIKGGYAFKNGDIVTVTKQPRIKVIIEFDGKGGKKIVSSTDLEKGAINVTSLRSENYTNEEIPTVISRLERKGISIKWGVVGDFKSGRQQAFFDPYRKEIVLNRDANLTDEQIIKVVLGHEAVHSVFPSRGTREWNNVINELSRVFEIEYSPSEWADKIAKIKEEYKKEGIAIDDKIATDELLTETMGSVLFDESKDATIIRSAYERLLVRQKELTAKLKDKTKDTEHIREELQDCNLAISTIEKLADSYNTLFTSKPKGALGKFWESLVSIMQIRKDAKKAKGNTFANDWNLNNVMVRAESALKRMHKLDNVTAEQQYEYIWRHQDIEPYFKEYIQYYPARFTNLKNKPFLKLITAKDGEVQVDNELLSKVKNSIGDNILSRSRTELEKEYRKQIENSNKNSNFETESILKIDQNEYTDDFRRVQEKSRGMLPKEVSSNHSGGLQGRNGDSIKEGLGRVYAGLLSRGTSRGVGSWSLKGKGNATFNMMRVNGELFHDIFEINRKYLENGELVDLHNSYDNCKCFISDDGLCGFAIEPNGNLVSVFSLNPSNKRGFLYAIKDFAIEQGATHLDAYASSKQNLRSIYEKVLGAKTASSMDYNMEYDHDNISANHGNPDVVFMVLGDASKRNITEKRFNGEQYDDAVSYQHAFLPKKNTKRIEFKKKDYGTPGTPGSIIQAEILFKAYSEDNFISQTIRNASGDTTVIEWMRLFKNALPDSYERLSKKYNFDFESLVPSTGSTIQTKNIAKVKNATNNITKNEHTQERESDTHDIQIEVGSRLDEYSAALYDAEQMRPKKPTVTDFEKKFGGRYASLSKEKKAEWVSEYSKANQEYEKQLKAYNEEIARVNREFEDVIDGFSSDESYDTRAFRINAKKMTGVEVDNYWRTVVSNLALESKSRQELFDNAYKVISEHISNHKIGELVRTRTDLKDILGILKNISTVKDVSIAEKDKALQEVAKQLDIITADVTLNTSIDSLKETIAETKTRIKSGLNKSEKYADNEKLSFINACKEGLGSPLAVDSKMSKTEKDIQALRDRISNEDLEEGETMELLESRLSDQTMRLEGLDLANKLNNMRNEKRTDISNLNAQYRKAKSDIAKEKAKSNPDTDKIVALQKIVDSYSNDKLQILQEYQSRLAYINKRFIDVETKSRVALKEQRESFNAEMGNIVKKANEDSIYSNKLLDEDVSINSTEYQNLIQDKRTFINKIRNAHAKAHGSLDYLLRLMTVQRASHEGYLVGEVSKWHNESQVKRNQLKTEALDLMYKSAKDVFGDKKLRKVIEEGDNLITNIDGSYIKLHKYKEIDGYYDRTGETLPTSDKNGYLSISEAVDLVFTSKQSQGRKALEKAGVRLEDVLHIETILKNNPTYSKHLEFLTKLKDGVIKMLGNEAQVVHEQLFGLKYIEELDYFPLSIAQTRANKGDTIKKSNYVGSNITPGYMISRSKVTSEYKTSNAYDKVMQYVTDMSQWIAFSPTAKKLNAVISNESFAKNVKAHIGEWYYDRIKAAANIEVGTYAPLSSNELYNELFAMTKVSKVAFRPITAFKQLTSGTTYMGFSADLSYQKDLAKYAAIGMGTMGYQNVKWCLDNMPRFKERYESGVAGDLFIGDLQALHASAFKYGKQKVMKAGMKMNAYIDAVTIACGSRAVYDYTVRRLTKHGVSLETAKEIALRTAEHEFNLTQASNESMFLSEGQASTTSSVIYKSLLAFKTPVLSLYRRSEQSFVDLYRLTTNGKEFCKRREDAYVKKYLEMGMSDIEARNAARHDVRTDAFKDVLNIVGTYALANITFSGTTAFVKWVNATINKNEEEAKKAWDELTSEVMYRSVAGGMPDMPIMGHTVNFAKEWLIDGKNGSRAFSNNFGDMILDIPGSSVKDMIKLIDSSVKLFSDGEKAEAFKTLGLLLETGFMLSVGVDAKTLNNYTTAAIAFVNGDFNKASAYALNLPPSALKLFEEGTDSNKSKSQPKQKRSLSEYYKNRK